MLHVGMVPGGLYVHWVLALTHRVQIALPGCFGHLSFWEWQRSQASLVRLRPGILLASGYQDRVDTPKTEFAACWSLNENSR